MKRVALTVEPVGGGYEHDELQEYVRSLGYELVYRPDLTRDPKDVVPRLHDVDAVLAGGDPFTAENLEKLPNVKIISRFGVGTDQVDLKKATELGIPVTNTPGLLRQVAELAVSMMLGLYRGLCIYDRKMKEGEWWHGFFGQDLEKKKVGLVGFGAIAQAVAKNLRGFECDIIAYDPYFNEKIAAELGVKQATVDEIAETCDIVSLHVPLTNETRGMINEAFFEKMKESAILINTARGPVVDEKALIYALQTKKIAGAAMDVFEKEPIDKDNPLLFMDNVIVTPHIASMTYEGCKRMGIAAANEIDAFFKGEPLKYLVNKDCVISR